MRTPFLSLFSAAFLVAQAANLAAQTSAPLVPAPEQSAHFAAVNQHLELGGVYYGYIDIDGDVNLLSQNLNEVLERVAMVQPQLAMFRQDYGPLLGMLGFGDVKAIGFSSVLVGTSYRNRTFLYTPQGRHGLLAAIGGAPHAFTDAHYAPADADFFAEMDVDLPTAYAALKQVVTKIGGDALLKPMESALQTRTSAGIVPYEIIQRLSGHVVLLARLNPDQRLTLPGNAAVEVPGLSFFLRVDGLGKPLEAALAQLPALRKTIVGNKTTYEMKQVVGGKSLQPIFALDGESLVLASDRRFLTECLERTSGLDQQAEFKTALSAVGLKGNGVTYITPRLLDGLRKTLSDVAATNPQLQAALGGALTKIPKIDQPLVSVRSNEADGILFRSSWNRSLKQDTAMVLAANPVTIGLLAAMAIPAFQKVRTSAQDKTIMNNLRQFQAAGQQYLLETGKTRATYSDIVGPGKYIKSLTPVAGEDYTKLVVTSEDDELSIRKENGQLIRIAH